MKDPYEKVFERFDEKYKSYQDFQLKDVWESITNDIKTELQKKGLEKHHPLCSGCSGGNNKLKPCRIHESIIRTNLIPKEAVVELLEGMKEKCMEPKTGKCTCGFNYKVDRAIKKL